MQYYYVDPEVAGEWGRSTIVDTSRHPPVVQKLDYEFSYWLGDPLLATFPSFIATDELRSLLVDADFTGIEFRPVTVTKSEQFEELPIAKDMPVFHWLLPTGQAGHSDFACDPAGRLVVSRPALEMLMRSGVRHATIETFTG